jgi:GT2 family glycosyltransferase
MPKHFSIIITHHKTPELLDLCLKSIKETIAGIKYEIILVDNESKEEARNFIKDKHPEVKILCFTKNLGYAKLINAGISQAGGNYLLILNADIIVLDNTVQTMLDYLENHPEVGIIGPQLLDFADNVQNSCFAHPTISAILARRTFFGKTKWGREALEKFTLKKRDKDSISEVDWVQGSAMLVRKAAIKKVGLWDERFFMYFEDADWCRRFWQNKYKVVYLPGAKMYHYYQRSSRKFGIFDAIFNKYTRIHIFSAIKYFLKYRKSQKLCL